MKAAETIGAALARGRDYLSRRGVEHAERNARFLLAHALALPHDALTIPLDSVVTPEAHRVYGQLLCRRGSKEPLQYLLGTWEFFGIELAVGKGALIPRPETETLVEAVLARLLSAATRVADVGTGSGCIALALAHRRPELTIFAIDRSPEALAVARKNLASFAPRVRALEGDLLSSLEGVVERHSLDAVVSNPPYVASSDLATLQAEVRDHEPMLALDGGADGLEVVARLAMESRDWLRPGGLLAIEIGFGQEPGARRCLAEYDEIEVVPDLAGVPRVVIGRR